MRKKQETVKRLSYEFNVSERTVRRDIEALSKMYPIYTKSGKYGGGVYILENFRQSTGYMSDGELSLLTRICNECDWLTAEDIKLINNIIKRYSQIKQTAIGWQSPCQPIAPIQRGLGENRAICHTN